MITERQYARDVTAADIEGLVAARQRELNELEFKVTADSDLLKAACGIANAGGGFILIGIDEDADHCASTIVNVENINGVCDSARQRLRDGLAPRPVIEVVPLRVRADAEIVVIRVSPQNPPHMVSHEKRTDFFGRYDATTERMRYEEIEQRFREKHEGVDLAVLATPTRTIETVLGRASASAGAAGVLEQIGSQLEGSSDSALALIAVCDGNMGSVREDDAITMLTHPVYERRGGWLVTHPSLEVRIENGLWVQRSSVSSISISSSGDVVFVKPIDEVLCWRQEEAAFRQSPRLYPNAVAEYCLSFAYLVADVAARVAPRQVLVQAVLSNARGVNLPLGEGGSVWFDAPAQQPRRFDADAAKSLVVAIDGTIPIVARKLAFDIAVQIYGFFGYLRENVAFAAEHELLQESDPETNVLTAVRSFIQQALRLPVGGFSIDHARDVYWFSFDYMGQRRVIGVTEEFVFDNQVTEARLFAALAQQDIPGFVATHDASQVGLLKTSGLEVA